MAHTLHLFAPAVARLHQPLRQRTEFHPVAGAQRDGQCRKTLGRQCAGHEGVNGGHHGGNRAGGHAVERRKAAALPLPGGNGVGPELPLPCQQRYRLLPGEALRVAGQLAGLPLIGAEEHCGPPGPGGHRSADAGPLHRRRAGEHGGTAAVFHPCDELRCLRQRLQYFQKSVHPTPPDFQIHAETGALTPWRGSAPAFLYAISSVVTPVLPQGVSYSHSWPSGSRFQGCPPPPEWPAQSSPPEFSAPPERAHR